MGIHEDKVVVLLKVSGTIEKAPEGQEFIPFFPGIAPSEVVGKNFETLAVDIHSIVDGKIQQSYHIEDWRTAVYQMIKGEPVPDFGFHPEYIQFERFNLTEHTHRVPKAIENFYDKMVRDFRDVVPDFEMERKATILHGDSVIVLSKMSGTIQNIGKIYDGQKENEISFLPGIPAEKFMGKRFETMHLAVHCIRDGKIKQNYHIEDWSTAIHQMLYNRPAPDFGFERDFVDF